MKFFPLLFSAAICLVACKKDSDAPTIDFGPNGGITVRDVNNRPQGATDPTDWTLDGTWNQQEQDLFKDLGLDLNTTATGSVSYMSAYPNPVGAGETVFGYGSATAVTASLVIVDANYRVMLSLPAAAASQSLVFRIDVSSLQKGKLYRLYYVFRNGSTLYYKGHGDIKIGV